MNNHFSWADWLTLLAPYTKFLLRWGWFIALLVMVAVVGTLLLPDTVISDSYQATLNIQVLMPGSNTNTMGVNAVTAFYSGLFVSPGALSLVLPKHPGLAISDLESLVSATPVADTSAIELSAIYDTPEHASTLVNDVYNTVMTDLRAKRFKVINELTGVLNNELKQTQSAATSSETLLQTLGNQNLTFSSEYRQVNSLYQQQLQHIDAINAQILILQQQGSGNSDILRLEGPSPDISTLPGNSPTRDQRLAFAPLVGLVMGLGGIFLASAVSNRVPLRGKKRETVLPWVNATIPVLPELNGTRLQALKQASPCLSLFRHLRYQSGEHEKQLRLVTVISPRGREGTSTVALGLATAAAQSELRTLLIDAHPERPVLHSWFGLQNKVGTLNAPQLLSDGKAASSAILDTRETNLRIIPIGNQQQAPDASTETLQVDVLRAFTELLCQEADIVIFDGPPLLSDANTISLVQLADIVLLVIDAQKSQSTAVVEAKNLLSAIGVSSALILNRAPSKSVE